MDKTEVKTLNAAAILMVYRDTVTQEADNLEKAMNDELNQAKAIAHERKIRINRLRKYAQKIQEAISEEMQIKLTEQKKLEEDYSFKGYHDLVDAINQ